MTETARHILAPALGPRQERVRQLLTRLAASPPQVLLLEAGEAEERSAMALYWALLLNCASSPKPCLDCADCARIAAQTHRDLFFFDGHTESIKIDQMRELRPILGQPPRELAYRVIILSEAQALTIEAANSLLKSLEEPALSTVFVLTAPQRERLLPTLVSRSWALTMAWPKDEPISHGPLAEWEATLASFLADGRGWFPKTMAKGNVDRELVRGMVRQIRGRLRQAMAGQSLPGPLGPILANLGPQGRRNLDVTLTQAQNALDFQVSPALVLDWLASQMFRSCR